MTTLMRNIVFALLLFVTGCSSLTDQELAEYMLPVNVVGGYFGAVAWHESGHAFTAEALGGHDTEISVWPTRDDKGKYHLGFTTTIFDGPPSDLEVTLFNTMGPTAMWVGHMGVRGLLRTGRMPRVIQPTLAWFGAMNQFGFYGQALLGLARVKNSDLGKEEPWISVLMISGGLVIDVIDMCTDGVDRYFGVLSGEHFYDYEEGKSQVGTMVIPQDGGGFLGIWVKW